MATTKSQQEAKERETKDRLNQRLNAIAEKVIKQLGRPANFFKVDVHPLFFDHFRANVITSDGDGLSATRHIAHSYFIKDVPDGLIADPPISKIYEFSKTEN